jgi:hypothetical protein
MPASRPGAKKAGSTASLLGSRRGVADERASHTGGRSSKTMNGTHTSLLNDGEDVVSEITSGTAVNTLQSPFTDEPIQRNGLYLTPNHLGSTTTLTDSTGNLAEQYFYLPFGQTGQSAETQSPFQFTGRENDGTRGAVPPARGLAAMQESSAGLAPG